MLTAAAYMMSELETEGISLQDEPQDRRNNSRGASITYAFAVTEVLPDRPDWTHAFRGLRLWGRKTELAPA